MSFLVYKQKGKIGSNKIIQDEIPCSAWEQVGKQESILSCQESILVAPGSKDAIQSEFWK